MRSLRKLIIPILLLLVVIAVASSKIAMTTGYKACWRGAEWHECP